MFKPCAIIKGTTIGITGTVGPLLPELSSAVTKPLYPAPEKYNSLLSYEVSISSDEIHHTL